MPEKQTLLHLRTSLSTLHHTAVAVGTREWSFPTVYPLLSDMGMMEDPDDLGLSNLSAGVQVTKDGMVRDNYRAFFFFFDPVPQSIPLLPPFEPPSPRAFSSHLIHISPSSPLKRQVRKEDFDNAIRSAQEALRAKTSSSQIMLQQASSAMRNAVTALSLSEQEVANLRVVVKELKEKPAESGNEVVERERAQLRAAQGRVAELSQNFRNLQSEVARMRYEQEGTQMPVASKLPIRIDPMLASKVVVIAQIVMLGYAYGDAENALDAVGVYDVAPAVEWLEARDVTKIQMLTDASAASRYKKSQTSNAGAYANNNTLAVNTARITQTSHSSQQQQKQKQQEQRQYNTTTTTTTTASRRQASNVNLIGRKGGYSTAGLQQQAGQIYSDSQMYSARKRALMMLGMIAVYPPPELSVQEQERSAFRAIDAISRLANGTGASMVLMLGGVRCGTDCLRIYPSNRDIIIAAFRLFRGLLVNPSTMIKMRRQQRFRMLPRVICEAVYSHYDDMEVCGEAAHALWAAATVGGTEAQDKIMSAGAVDFIRDTLSRPKRDDPTGKQTKKLIGCLLALATRNKRIQDVMVDTGVRALIRKGLVEHSQISFHGEFSALRDWTKAEFSNPTPLPQGVVIDSNDEAAPGGKTQQQLQLQQQQSSSAAYSSQQQQQQQQHNTATTTTTTTTTQHVTTAAERQTKSQARNARGGGARAVKRPGVTAEMLYAAKKRAVTMLAAVAVNPPGRAANVTAAESEEIAFRCLLALAKLANADAAYLVLIHGGPRASIDCLRLYLHNVDITYASFKVIRGLLQNPSTMMKFRKQKRFRIVPATVMDGVNRHHEDLDVRAEAAHTLWAYAGVGGNDAQELIVSVEFLPVIKAGLERARGIEGDGGGERVRKFVGCILALAKGNPAIQDLLVQEGFRGLVRKCLVEHPTVSFHGEFTDLRDWIRGDRGGAKSVVSSQGRRDKSVERREKNIAETTLTKVGTTTTPLSDTFTLPGPEGGFIFPNVFRPTAPPASHPETWKEKRKDIIIN